MAPWHMVVPACEDCTPASFSVPRTWYSPSRFLRACGGIGRFCAIVASRALAPYSAVCTAMLRDSARYAVSFGHTAHSHTSQDTHTQVRPHTQVRLAKRPTEATRRSSWKRSQIARGRTPQWEPVVTHAHACVYQVPVDQQHGVRASPAQRITSKRFDAHAAPTGEPAGRSCLRTRCASVRLKHQIWLDWRMSEPL